MHDMDMLRVEHVSIGLMANSLAAMVSQPSPGNCLDLFRVRSELRGALLTHLAREDWVVYPKLLASNRPEVRDLAHRLVSGAAAFSAAFHVYSRRWTTPNIAADWPGFCSETLSILGALQRRVNFEDNELYPLMVEHENDVGEPNKVAGRRSPPVLRAA